MTDLTDRQGQALNVIVTLVEQRGYPPSVREIAEYLGLSSATTAWAHVQALVKKGYLEVGPGPRMITVLRRAS